MSFAGNYELESQENYVEFLEAIDFLKAKTEQNVTVEVIQEGDDFTWTQKTTNWTWSSKFTIGQECELVSMKGQKFKAVVSLDGGKMSLQFPEYHFTAEIVNEKLLMTCVTPGEKGVTFKRVFKRI